jgi:PAS domain S-box-containing protein
MNSAALDKSLRILLVEDSPSDAALLQENILLSGVKDSRVHVVQSLHEAADYLKNNHVDAVLLDLTLPDSSGLDTVREIGRIAPDLPVVVLTGTDDEKMGIEAVRMGVQDYLVKGRADGQIIIRAIHYAIERKQMDNALRQARDELEQKVQERTAEIAQTVVMLRHEIAQRMRAEEVTRERSRVLDAFFSHTVMPLVILDKEFNFVRVNQAYADCCERDISEFIGHNHFEFYPHEENQRIFEQVVKTKEPYEAVAKPFSFPDHPEWGVTYWDWTLVPILDEDDQVELLVYSLEDVTARKRSELALEESEARYRALVELSPDPILVVADDKIAFANPACVELAGLRSADELVGREIWDFTHPDSRRAAETLLHATYRGRKKTPLTELKALRPDGRTVDVELSAGPIRYEGEPAVQAVIRDITERKKQHARDSVTRVLLELFAQKTSMKEYLDSVVKIIRIWSGCSCVGIRLTNAEGYIPYESCAGFSEEFVSVESMLCLNKDVCACIRVVAQAPDPQDARVMTERGSFRCDDMLRFFQSLTEAEKARYRSHCLKRGFASVAVVPIHYRQKILGAIHLADEQQNKVPLENVQFLESMAALIGEAVRRFDVEQALRLSESRLLEAQRIAHLGNWEMDYVINKLWWSDEVYRIFGLEPQRFGATYEAFLSYVHPEDRAAVETAVNEALYSNKLYSIDHRIIRPDGSQRIVHERAKVFYDAEKKPVRMMGTVQDMTEIKQAEERILADQAALRSLTSELQLAEERERRRIAGDLHDSIGQILALSKWELVRLQKSASAETAASLNEVAKQLDIAVKQARTLSFDLSPSVLYDLGFEVALEDLAERFTRERKIKCEFRSTAGREPLPDAVKVLLYRSVRELLINVAKHANATVVRILVDKIDNNLHITVEDNGDGFDVSVFNGQSRRPKGFGVLSIQERLRHIGGHFEIQSGNGSGTKVTLVAPTGTPESIEQDAL